MKTKTKAIHTPGPWIVDGIGLVASTRRTIYIEGPDGPIICETPENWSLPRKVEAADANALLIAAAPDMKIVVDLCAEWFGLEDRAGKQPYYARSNKIRAALRAAIAKAEGDA